MKWTLATACIFLIATVTTVNGLQTLSYPVFSVGKTYVYDASINLTARIPGLHSQVSKRVLTMKVKIRAEKRDNFALKIDDLLGSGSLSSVSSDTDAVNLKPNAALESRLKLPIRFFYQWGEVKNYTLDSKESLESQKIKRTILRNLELYIDSEALGKDIDAFPVMYSKRKPSIFQTPSGNYSSHYTIISSPHYTDNDQITVFNISRVDNYESISYDAYETFTNFMAQGCSQVCRKDDKQGQFDARCPIGYESYERPIKKSFVQNHNLQTDEEEVLLDSVETKETHVANLYDQSMEVAIKSIMKFKEVNSEKILPPKFQTELTDLNKYFEEINEKEIAKLCGGVNETQAVTAAKTLLREVASIVVADNLDNSISSQVGEKLVLLKNALTVLSEEGLRHVQEDMVPAYRLIGVKATESVKRQIWIDMLPVIGTKDSVTFITNIIQENMNVLKKSMSIYEASSVLNSLPGNIKQVNDQMIRQLSKLLDLISDHKQRGYSYFFSASHIALARTVNKLCSQRKDNIGEESEPETKDNRSNSVNDIFNENGENILSRYICKSINVQEFFMHITKQLESSKEFTKTIIYIETIARTGILEALNSLTLFVMGKMSETSPSKSEYLRIASIKALHSMVDRYPKEVQHLVKPIYLNQSESFKVRIPAFSVLIRTNPSLGLLQQVAEATWREMSPEVGSYVTSALETFGNSTLPCGQLLAHRIKMIFPQIKRFGGDYHRSKSLMWSLFDDLKNFGLAKFFQFSANSDSLFPNTLYGAVEYNVDSFRDFILQYSAQIEGFSGSKFYNSILKALKLDPNEPIPESIVQDVFKQVNLTNKEQEPWRLSLYHKMFYSMSFNHVDGEDTSVYELVKSTLLHLLPYFKPSGDRFIGTFVKVHMPSSYQSKAVGQAYPSRVQFGMENPFLSSLKLNVLYDTQNHSNIILSFQPSTYSSVIYTNQILSFGDCQNIGVYHQSNAAMSFSADLNVTAIDKDIKFSYSFPQVPKTVFKYNSGAGTYTGKTRVTSLPMNENRAPIKTAAVPNKREKKFKMIGSPPFVSKIVTEDIFEDKEKQPKGIKQTLNYIIRKFRNCGWRNKTIEVKRVPEEGYWISDTKVTFQTKVGRIIRNLVSYQQTPLDVLINVLELDQTSPTDTVKTYTQEALALYNALDENFCHTEDSWHFNVSKTGIQSNSSDSFWFSIKSIRKSTLVRGLYHIHSEFETKFFGVQNTSKGGVDLISTFTGFSNPFSYDDASYGQQKAIMFFAVNFAKGGPFEDTHWLLKASLGYESPTVFHYNKSLAIPDTLYMMPETHSECLEDMKEGKTFSLACLKAFRERTMYNKLKWLKTKSSKIHNIEILTDYINQFKFLEKDILNRKKFFLDEDIQTVSNIRASGRYIDKLYDRSVYEINFKKSNKSADYLIPVNFLILPILSMENRMDTYLMKATNNSYPATCVWMDKYLLTYDLETYSLPDVPQNCSFVMSAHCVKDKMFAVVVKTDFERDSSKEVTVYLGSNTISFRKTSRWFYIGFNGREQRLTHRNTTSLMGGNVAVANLIEEGDINVLEVTVFRAGLQFWYDGVRVLLKVSPRYKGELCGMCGQFDGEKHSEFKGLDGKLYRDTNQDFLETFTLGKCFKKELNPVKKYMSPEDPDISSEEVEAEDVYTDSSDYDGNSDEETSTLRNIVLSRNDQFCFSLLPFLTCVREPSEMQEEEVEFKCFLKSNPLTRNWVAEAKTRILMEMNRQECDFIEMVSIPKKC